MKWGIPLIFLFIACVAHAQSQDNRRCIWSKSSSLKINENIDPSTIYIQDSLGFNFEADTNTISLTDEFTADSVKICFRVLSVHDSTLVHKTLILYDSMAIDYRIKFMTSGISKEKLFETGDVNTTGRLTRGFSLGSNQDVFVNSALNLTMDGKLSEDLRIQATISDQTIPFQPEGNTAQLQDLDRVFMKIYNDKLSVTGGDILLAGRDSHFLKYYKNVKGALFQSSGIESSTMVGASVAKGKFASVAITALEGVLGPYRIPRPDGQSFLIVLANSERVYLDGKLMQRGFDMDYIIDYNLAEISFTPRIIISQFSRIRIDYEYSDRSYSRFIIAGRHEQQIGKFKFSANVYSEKDNKNSPNFQLNDEDKKKLSEAGDNPLKAITATSDSVEFDQQKILYKKVWIQNTEIFVHSTNPDSAYWSVSFNKVGIYNGNYKQKISTANGRVYEWVSLKDGVPQGDFVPYAIIPAPSKKQMVEIAGSYKLSNHEELSTTLSISNNDQNLYSNKDDHNNSGQAINVSGKSSGRKLGSTGWKYDIYGGLEFLSSNFSGVDRFRHVEFDRDWSYKPSKADSVNDLIIMAGVGAKKDELNLIAFDFSHRDKLNAVNGNQLAFRFNKEAGNLRLISNLFTSTNSITSYDASWKKIHTDLSYLFSNIRMGYTFNNQENIVSSFDSILYSANYFYEHIAYIRSEDSKKGTIDVSYRTRTTKQPNGGSLTLSNLSHTINASYSRRFSTSQDLRFSFTYRELINKGETVDFGSGNSITSRLDWLGLFFDRNIKNDLTWSVSNSRELRKEYVFIEVPTGQGNYTWVDYNDDGIMDLNEFNLAINIDERRYAKIFTPTTEYINAYENTFNYKFRLQFPRSWRKMGGLKYILSKLSNSTAWTSISRITDSSISSRLFAFAKPLSREDILSTRENIRTTWFFNKGHPKYGLSGGYSQLRNLNLLMGGFEDRMIKEMNFTGRINLGRPFSVKLTSKIGNELSESDFLSTKNFIISNKVIKPSFTWQPKPNLRFNAGYGFRRRNNIGSGEVAPEEAIINELSAEFRISKIQKSNIQAMITLSNVDFQGNELSPAGYVVLAGLSPGLNLNWSISWQQTLINGLQLSVFYHARKSEISNIIHTGSVSMSALF